MSGESENSLVSRITDIETFSWYLVSFRNSVFATIPQTPPKYRVLIDDKGTNLTDLKAKYGLPTTPTIRIDDCPWENVTDSLREIILRQFDAASKEAPKSLRIEITPTEIELWLKSPYISGFINWLAIDRSTERVISGRGLELSLKPGDRLGYWTILKRKITEADLAYRVGMDEGGVVNRYFQAEFLGDDPQREIMEEFTYLHGVIEDLNKKSTIYSRATIPQLHGISELIEQQKKNSRWYR